MAPPTVTAIFPVDAAPVAPARSSTRSFFGFPTRLPPSPLLSPSSAPMGHTMRKTYRLFFLLLSTRTAVTLHELSSLKYPLGSWKICVPIQNN